ncbi:DUF4442 domain-containing protein [Kerstersia gyiorum]|uniref:DUF4442 domain-containing protein n=1 Tax=Kerstersia gyiorum TaxID=206506 RepID=UPI001EE6DA29|nr:DUF4442 domain-containing protein [Kerstersia gyiorum]MCO7641274.1 DUF4442 domain-containing protein [Pseudomonas sp. S 311-6]MCP1634773.1 acyl-coenzyme A thioesterase PaaI-like protein [Kerstersia gyiorum]MCP1638097.1 acyl-coenzyme A thioesterase PaaI-like protein [Kerstersia gyiorum]MCP1672687.1 acyl-coenzyme A thioesterase PaaI-like protein [Kerstersia gyiorum]MCP1680601.1 acyl-coenzyme A thioesterase PaaI-like protein [Kerstersia gyiorum]
MSTPLDWLSRLPLAWRAPAVRLGFNMHPGFRGMGGRVVHVEPDLSCMRVRLPWRRRTRNMLGSIYGGSLFGVTDGPHPLLLTLRLGRDVIIWDKQAAIRFRRPAYQVLYADFRVTDDEVASIRQVLDQEHETIRVYNVDLVDTQGTVYATVERTLYIATRAHYAERKREKELGARQAAASADAESTQ